MIEFLSFNLRSTSKSNSVHPVPHFSLMFACQVNVDLNSNNLNFSRHPAIYIKGLHKRIEYMNSIVFPALHERTQSLTKIYNKCIGKRRYFLPELAIDAPVMVCLEEGRSSKLAPLYAGSYFVVKRTQAGNHICDTE